MGWKKIKSLERVSRSKARVALVSLRDFIKTVNTQRPDLKDPNIKLIYETTKLKHKPGSSKNPGMNLNQSMRVV